MASHSNQPDAGEHHVGDDDARQAGADRRSLSKRVFDELQTEVEETPPEEVLEDPEYLDFLESFGQLSVEEDELTLDELLEQDAGQPASSSERPSGTDSPEPEGSEVVDKLLAEFERGAVTPTQRAALRTALGLEERKRLEVQLNHLKSRFIDLEAYIQAMEEFLDEEDDPLEAIDALQSDLATVTAVVDAQIDRLEAVERAVTVLAQQQKTRQKDLAALEASVEQTRRTLKRNFAVIETELKRNREWRERVTPAATRDHER